MWASGSRPGQTGACREAAAYGGGMGWGLFSMNGQASLGDKVLQEQVPPVSRDISDLDEGLERDWWVFTEQAKERGSLWSVTVGPLYPQACWFLTGAQESTLPWKGPCGSRCGFSGPSDEPVIHHGRFSS